MNELDMYTLQVIMDFVNQCKDEKFSSQQIIDGLKDMIQEELEVDDLTKEGKVVRIY